MRTLDSARRHHAWSALLGRRAVREARKARRQGVAAAASVVAVHQATAAAQAQPAVAQMLAEQSINEAAQGLLNSLAFTTTLDSFTSMLEQVDTDWQFDRLVASLVASSGRSAESVAITATPRVSYVRYLNPPSCSRCAVLAGRIYRWSTGFKRHPGCDCVMLPTTETAGADLVSDPSDLLDKGLVTGLAKADAEALRDGASWSQVVNAKSGLMDADLFGRRMQVTTSGSTRRGGFGRSTTARAAGYTKADGRYRITNAQRLTPRSIYDVADGDRDEAVRLLKLYGYIT